MPQAASYYEVLGVTKDATGTQIKRAYKKACLLHHPDKNPDDRQAAEERFKAICEAYETLSDAQRRAAYDQQEDLHDMYANGFGDYGGWDTDFGTNFNSNFNSSSSSSGAQHRRPPAPHHHPPPRRRAAAADPHFNSDFNNSDFNFDPRRAYGVGGGVRRPAPFGGSDVFGSMDRMFDDLFAASGFGGFGGGFMRGRGGGGGGGGGGAADPFGSMFGGAPFGMGFGGFGGSFGGMFSDTSWGGSAGGGGGGFHDTPQAQAPADAVRTSSSTTTTWGAGSTCRSVRVTSYTDASGAQTRVTDTTVTHPDGRRETTREQGVGAGADTMQQLPAAQQQQHADGAQQQHGYGAQQQQAQSQYGGYGYMGF